MKRLDDPSSRLPSRLSYPESYPSSFIDAAGPGPWLDYWNTLGRHKGTLLLIALLGLITGVLLTLPQPPVYQARTTIEIQNLNENFLNMRDVTPTESPVGTNPLETDLQTQVSILQSESVLHAVIGRLNLPERLWRRQAPNHFSGLRQALGLGSKKPPGPDDLLQMVAANLKVRAQGNTRLVEIRYDDPDPQLAADIANTLTAEFIEQNLESRWKTSQQTGDWLTRQMEDARIKLEKSEQELQTYARDTGLVFTAEKDNVAEAKLRQLQEELSKAQADRVARQSKFELTRTVSPDSLPEVLDDATLKDYQVKLTDLRRQLAEISSSLTPAHPAVKKVQAQVATLEAALERERANVTTRIQNEFESAQRRERLLAASYDAQSHVVSEQAGHVTHYDILKREVDNNRQLYDSMLQHVKEAAVASALRASNIRVVDPARPPSTPYKPRIMMNATLGLLGGVFVGMIFVLLRERVDESIRAPGEASLYLDLPELGVIPAADSERGRGFARYYRHRFPTSPNAGENGKQRGPVELVISQGKPSVVAEGFRSTVLSLLYGGENGERFRVIAVTSAGPGEGKTTVAANLAQAAAETGRRVLLVDGDLRKPRLHKVFNAPNDWGLSDLLGGIKPPAGTPGTVAATGCRGLHLLTAGSAATNIASLLHSPRASEFLRRMREEFEMIIIDTPPMLQMPDARLLGRMADAVILVVRSGDTTKETAAAASQRLAEDGTRVLGAVLNEWDPRKTRRGVYECGYEQLSS